MLKIAAERMEVEEAKSEDVWRLVKERGERLRKKKMHRKVFKDIEGFADSRSLNAGYLAKSTEVYFFSY